VSGWDVATSAGGDGGAGPLGSSCPGTGAPPCWSPSSTARRARAAVHGALRRPRAPRGPGVVPRRRVEPGEDVVRPPCARPTRRSGWSSTRRTCSACSTTARRRSAWSRRPVVARVAWPAPLRIDAGEVAEAFTLPLASARGVPAPCARPAARGRRARSTATTSAAAACGAHRQRRQGPARPPRLRRARASLVGTGGGGA
jgi:hypothetical protein